MAFTWSDLAQSLSLRPTRVLTFVFNDSSVDKYEILINIVHPLADACNMFKGFLMLSVKILRRRCLTVQGGATL